MIILRAESFFKKSLIGGLCFFLMGCATYQHKTMAAKRHMSEGRYLEAAESLKELAFKKSDDQLVYLLDYGIALQLAGQYKESNEALLLADRLMDIKDYHSLTRIGGSLALNEGMVQYKGEDYEKVLVNAILSINYLMLNDKEGALVEVRRLNEKLYKFKNEAGKDYEQNVFATYLSALIWESNRNWDDAYIAFNEAHKINSQLNFLGSDLIRASKKAQRPDEFKKWRQQYSEFSYLKEWDDRKYGELVLIYQQGWSPQKVPRPENFRFPMLRPVRSLSQKARLAVEGQGEVESEFVFSVEDVAIKTLNDDYAALVAKRVVGIVVKDQIAKQIEEKNELLGSLAWIAMNVADQADLRQWSTLPQTFQIARMYLPEGKYQVKALGFTSYGTPTGENKDFGEIQIRAQDKTFINWRSLQ